jgi:hypothetical protein
VVLIPPDSPIEEVAKVFGDEVEIDPEETFTCPGLQFDPSIMSKVVPLCAARMPLIMLVLTGRLLHLPFDSETHISEVKVVVCPKEHISQVHLYDSDGELRDTDIVGKRRVITVRSDPERRQVAAISGHSIRVKLGRDEKSFTFDEMNNTVADA